MIKLKLSLQYWETFGDSSLKGFLFEQFPDIVQGEHIVLEFTETTIQWRKNHNGPKTLLSPEFMPLCFANDLLWLFHNFNVELKSSNE